MLSIDLQGEVREISKKSDTKLSRVNGLVPCVLYGGAEVVHFLVNAIKFEKVYITPNVYVVNLSIDGKSYKAIIKDIQFHPVTDAPMHVDFYEISETKPFTVKIPVNIVGVSDGVKQGGKLQVKLRKLRVNGLLKDIPTNLDVDITPLAIGQSVKIGTLEYKGLTILENKNGVVCTVNLTRAVRAAQQEANKK